jgi:hypothetical protein
VNKQSMLVVPRHSGAEALRRSWHIPPGYVRVITIGGVSVYDDNRELKSIFTMVPFYDNGVE